MLIISTREFRQKQKMYLDLVDKNEQVIVLRGNNRAYALTPITETDRYFSDPEIKKRLSHSIEQANQGEVIVVSRGDINTLLGL